MRWTKKTLCYVTYCRLAMHAAKVSWTETVKTNHHQRIMPAIAAVWTVIRTTSRNSLGRACRFANPLTDSEIVQKIDDAVPMSTRKTTQWSIKLWDWDWLQHRLTTATCSSDIPPALWSSRRRWKLRNQVLRWKRILMIVPLLLILVTALWQPANYK